MSTDNKQYVNDAMADIIDAVASLPFDAQHDIIRSALVLNVSALSAPATIAWAKINATLIIETIKRENVARQAKKLTQE